MEEEKSESARKPKKIRKNFLAVMLTAIIAAAGVGGYNYFNSEEPPPKPSKKKVVEQAEPAKGIGFINFDLVQDRHSDGEYLSELKQLEIRLRLELKDAMKPVIITPPKLEETPFDDSIWQKNAQTIIGEAAEIEKRKKQAAEEYKKSTEAEYLKKRDEANDKFLNEILNIKLKLQNADNMRLTKDEITALQNRLEEIQIERNKLQAELINQWTQEINVAAEEAIKDDVAKLKAQAEEVKEKVTQEAKQAQIIAAERNKSAMEQAVKDSIARQDKRQQLMTELKNTAEERIKLENKIMDDISDFATKLAVIHKLKLVLVNKAVNLSDEILIPDYFNDSLPKLSAQTANGTAIFATSEGIDLTEELLTEMERSAKFSKK